MYGFVAGVLISAGGAVFIGCDNKIAGAVLFSMALLCICMKGYYLFTGRVCYMIDDHSKTNFRTLLLCLFGNTVGCILCGYAVRYAIPASGENAAVICAAKLANQALPQTLIRGIFCGLMVYLAVSIYKQKNSSLGIIFCIPVFILSGFEHSVADIFYFAASGIVSFDAFVFILTVIIGNSIGGLMMPFVHKISGEEAK